MSKRNSLELPNKKIPIRSPRSTLPTTLIHHQISTHLNNKYLSISVNAFCYRKVQNILLNRHAARELVDLSG